MRLARPAIAMATVAALLFGASPLTDSAHAAPTNLGLNRPVTASGTETGSGFAPERAFDGDIGPADPTPPAVHNAPTASRWSANSVDDPWISVDLGAAADLDSVRVRWGNQFATNYTLLGSTDGSSWTTLATDQVGVKGTWITTDLDDSGINHVKLQVNSRNSTWPVAIWEIEVLGTLEAPPVAQVPVDVVPLPQSVTAAQGTGYRLTEATSVVAGDSAAADRFAETLRASSGLPLPRSASGSGIEFVIDADTEVSGVAGEGYLLHSDQDGVTVTARTEAGLANGSQTLLQLLGPWSGAERPVVQEWTVPAVDIADGPRYEWRGFMLDTARSFVPKDEVFEIIDQLAAYKLNVLHMHMTDDQGWRIAISNEGRVPGDTIDYSLLTSVSGQTAVATTQWTTITGRTGYYTAEDFAQIVEYAGERNIAIVPEIDGPAHAQAILHALPEANTANSVPQPLPGHTTAPANTTTSVGESTLDTRAEATYTILNQVMTQLLEATPASLNGVRYLHIGGDESFSTSNTDYRYFIDRVTDNANALGATAMAWNEGAAHAADELPDGSVIHYWNGGTAATREWVEANNGRALMSPASTAYLPQVPGAGLAGPSWACGGPCNIERFYNWNPTTMLGSTEDRVLGVEAALWSEHIRTLSSAEFMMYPRLMATAEVGWTAQSRRNLVDFRGRLQSVVSRLTADGRNFYAGDGTWRTDLVALRTGKSGPTGIGDIAWMSSPTARVSDVSAQLTIEGQSYPVEVSVDRPYATGQSNSFDGRQASGLFRFEPGAALPDGTHDATLNVTVGGVTSSVMVPLNIDAAGPVIEPVADQQAMFGAPVDLGISASDPSGPITFEAEGLPAGLLIDAATGRITGAPTGAESTTVTVRARDAFGNASTVRFGFEITPRVEPTPTPTPTLTPTPTPGWTPSAPYTVPGLHFINGRQWNTSCEAYSQTTRCRTDIWATVVIKTSKGFEIRRGWAFNNLTYLPYMTRAQWANNNLGHATAWTAADGRRWYTECDTAQTGQGACRSYTWTTVYSATAKPGGGYTFSQTNKWVFNNIVMFKDR